MHVPDIDVLSACVTLRDCLSIIRRWSIAHPDHTPILLMFNTKTDAAAIPGGTDALPFDVAAFDALDGIWVIIVFHRNASIAKPQCQDSPIAKVSVTGRFRGSGLPYSNPGKHRQRQNRVPVMIVSIDPGETENDQ